MNTKIINKNKYRKYFFFDNNEINFIRMHISYQDNFQNYFRTLYGYKIFKTLSGLISFILT